MSSPAPGTPDLVLASSSPYRRALLARLGLPFRCVAPAIDESPQPGETPRALVRRLSAAKAAAVAARHPRALVIGSDQVAVDGARVVGKPGDRTAAIAQLSAASGRRLTFLTGLSLQAGADAVPEVAVVATEVAFRSLTVAEIETYVDREQPWDCAGSFKAEALGIVLFERISSDDPSALTGLPLIALCGMLARCGHPVLTWPRA